MNSARFEKYLICIVITICSMNEKQSEISTILSYSIPGIISMLLSAALTLTDGYFTGNYVGEEALAAINLGLPILYVFLGVGLCTGVGGLHSEYDHIAWDEYHCIPPVLHFLYPCPQLPQS